MKIKPLHACVCVVSVVSIVFAALFSISAPASAQQATAVYKSNFLLAEQSIDPQGRTVVVMQGTGDLPGVLTLVLHVGADGSISDGEWALNVSYTAPSHPEAQIDPTLQDPDAAQGEKLVQKGVLSGTVNGGSATSANGFVSNINALQLVITHGTMQFAAVTQGSGSVTGTRIDQRANSSAFTSLTF